MSFTLPENIYFRARATWWTHKGRWNCLSSNSPVLPSGPTTYAGHFDTKYRFYCAGKCTRTPLLDLELSRYCSEMFASHGNNIKIIFLFFFYKRLRISMEYPFKSNWKKWNGKKRFIDYRSLDGERRYSLFRSYHSVWSLIGCTRLRGGGLVSRVGGVRYGWCMPYGQKKGSCWSDRMLIISTKASSCLLSPTWFADGTIIYAAIMRERERTRLRDR